MGYFKRTQQVLLTLLAITFIAFIVIFIVAIKGMPIN